MTHGAKFSDLLGKTVAAVEGAAKDSGEITFRLTDGSAYRMFHYQDCCESVAVADITGNVSDIIGAEILMADESSNSGETGDYESYTWTFYKFGTINGYLDIRWLGSSNGYYSESVSFEKVA